MELYAAANISIKYLPLYCPEFNPIKLSFYDLKAWIWLNVHLIQDYKSFGTFLQFGVQCIGIRCLA